MTRKEAKDYSWFRSTRVSIEKHIDKIFDDHEAQNAEILRTLHLLDSLSAMDRQTAIDELIKVLEDA